MRWFSHPGMKRSSQGEIQSGQQHCPRLEGPGVITLSKTPGEVTDKVWALLGDVGKPCLHKHIVSHFSC